jgi:hypothetical protein
MKAAVGTEIRGAWRYLLERPTRTARIMEAWGRSVDMLRDLVLATEVICRASSVDPDDFTRSFDATVTINVHQQYVIIDLSET